MVRTQVMKGSESSWESESEGTRNGGRRGRGTY